MSKSTIRNLNFSLFGLILVFNLLGCETLKEGYRGFLGTSIRVLEDARKDAARQRFSYNYDLCYDNSLKVLKEEMHHIYAKDKTKDYIAVYFSLTDTTPVGIFFNKIDADNTEIEVSSQSTYAREAVATKLFSGLIIMLNPAKEKTSLLKN